MTDKAMFSCPFCDSDTKPIPHDKGDHLTIAKCEDCNMILFFVYSKKAGWHFRNYEKPREDKEGKK